MSMNRRNFLTMPLLALGAGAYARAIMGASVDGSLTFGLLRLHGSDGTRADAGLQKTVWQLVGTATAVAQAARVTLHGFVPASTRGPRSAHIHALYAAADANESTHDLYRYSAAQEVANSKAVGFDAVAGAFSGFRVRMGSPDGEWQVRMGDAKIPPLAPGLYALLIDRSALSSKYTFSGDRTKPLVDVHGATPNYLAFSVTEIV
jgi:hypothetical protein